jgi:hypothetical protein
MRAGSRYLWGRFPLFLLNDTKELYGKSNGRVAVDGDPKEAAKIPYPISLGLCRSMEAAWAGTTTSP